MGPPGVSAVRAVPLLQGPGYCLSQTRASSSVWKRRIG